MARAQAAVPPTAIRVVRVRPRRSASRPNTKPPSGRPKSIATTTRAAVDAVTAGPAKTSIAGASAVKGKNTWILSIQLPTTPARRAARPSGGRSLSLVGDGVVISEVVIGFRPEPVSAGRIRPRVSQRSSFVTVGHDRSGLAAHDLNRHGGQRRD